MNGRKQTIEIRRQQLFGKLQKRCNYQDALYDFCYITGLDFPRFMGKPKEVKRDLTIFSVDTAIYDCVKPFVESLHITPHT